MESSESTFIDSEEDEIFFGKDLTEERRSIYVQSGILSRKTLIQNQSLDASTTCSTSIAASVQDEPGKLVENLSGVSLDAMQMPIADVGEKPVMPTENLPSNIVMKCTVQDEPGKLVENLSGVSLDAMQMPIADVGEKPVMPTENLPSNIVMKCTVQDEPSELASKEDMLLLALQRRFEKHKVDLPNLCDLNLDDTAAENESLAANFHDQCNASVELLANCSMPQFSNSPTEDSLTPQCNLLGKSIGNARDLDTTARFLELEKSCLTPRKSEDDGQECPAELSTDDLSTVSADADGGFLTGLTKLALMHATLNGDSISMPPFSPTVVEEKSCATDGEYIEEDINISISPLILDKSNEDYLSEESSSEVSLNTTFDELNMLEAYGAHYMVSAEKDLIKKGLENSINVSLSKDQQDLLDSFADHSTLTKPGVNRDISRAFEPCKDVIASDSGLKSADFQFPKPLSTVAGSHSKTKYRHQTTPMKQFSPKPVPIANSVSTGKFFGPSTVKTALLGSKTKFFTGSPQNGNREIPKTLVKTSVSSTKMSDLKKIESPIGHYIHDSPVPSLVSRKHVPFAGLQKNNKVFIETDEEKKASAENIDFNNMVERNMALPPQKSYQSTSSLQKMTPAKTKLPLLSGKSKQLVSTPKAMVMKHTGRVKASELPSSSPLSKVPAAVNDSCFSFSERTLDAEVSVVVAKEATKSSTIK